MKLPALALLAVLFAVSAAAAQPLPVGSGVIRFEERFKIGGGCDSYSAPGFAVFSVFPDGSFSVQTEAGAFRGTLRPANRKGLVWHLSFDDSSRSFYRLYLQAGASVLCGTPVTVGSPAIESFVLKLAKDRAQASFSLRASASGASAYGTGRGKHQIKGKGPFSPGLLPASPGNAISGTLAQHHGGATITMVSPTQLAAPTDPAQ